MEPSAATPETAPAGAGRRTRRPRDWVPFVVFALLWLVPITFTGLVRKPIPLVGRYFNDLTSVGCLFIVSPLSWESWHVEYRTAPDGPWVEIPRDELSTMHPFGHTSRVEMLLGRTTQDRRGILQRQRIAEWAAKRWAELHPDRAPVEAIRISLALELVSEYERAYAKGAGAWAWRPLVDYDEGRVQAMSTHFLDGRAPIDAETGELSRARYEEISTCPP